MADLKPDSENSPRQIPVNVSKVYVHGLKRTDDEFVKDITRRMLIARSLEEVVEKSHEIHSVLMRLGVARSVGVHIDAAKGKEVKGDIAYDVHISMTEKRWYGGGIQGYFGNDAESNVGIGLTARGVLPNMIGRGEQARVLWTKGLTTGMREIVIEKPVGGQDKDIKLSGNLFNHIADYPLSGFKETDHGMTASVTTPLTASTVQKFSWLGVWRQLIPLADAAFPVREQAGHYLKSSIKSETTWDTRDDKTLPSKGGRLSGTFELAGLGGDSHFISSKLAAQYNHMLPLGGLILQLNFGTGVVFPMNVFQSKNGSLTIMDKFFLGGPTCLRGFGHKGIGPRYQNSSLGADSYWHAGAHLQIPLSEKNPLLNKFRLQAFANTGNLMDWPSGLSLKELVQLDLDSTRLTYGLGLVTNFLGLKAELNYCWPMRFQKEDKVHHGFQFGVHLED